MTSLATEIPLKQTPQKLAISLNGVSYFLTLKWNSVSSLWTLDIADSNETPIISGIALVANTDLLGPYGYLNFGGQLVAWTDGDVNIPPTFKNLGQLGHVYFLTLP